MAEVRTVTTRVGDGGRLVIPVAFRRELGIEPGDAVTLRIEDGELRVESRARTIQWAQQLMRRYVPEGVSLVEELIQERREESSRE